MHARTTLALSRLRKELNLSVIPFSSIIWQQGEAEANHTRMSTQAYKMRFYDVVADLRANAVFAPVFVACTTLCEAGPHPFDNRVAIRQALLELPDPAGEFSPGPTSIRLVRKTDLTAAIFPSTAFSAAPNCGCRR
jgi:hypothetical protein